MKIKQLITLLGVFGYLLFVSCDDELSTMTSDEPLKDITGKWNVVQLTRNGEDLTKRLNLTGFSIDFKEDGTYNLSEQLPFVVPGSGIYRLNDPQYPFSILMSAADNPDEVAVNLQYPVVAGKRQLSLSFSLGCSGNSYQYNFERE